MSEAGPDDEELSSRQQILRFASQLRFAIGVIATVVAGVFAWVYLRHIHFGPALTYTEPILVQQFTLALFYFCWLFGSRNDVGVQASVYLRDPFGARIGLTTLILLVTFTLLALALFWSSDDYGRFAIVLTGLGVFGAVNLYYTLQRLRPIITASREGYRAHGDFFGLARLNMVARYAAGQWQILRCATMCLLIVGIDVLCFANGIRHAMATALTEWISGVSTEKVSELLPSFSFLVYVVITEGWIWLMRARTTIAMQVIDDLKEQYRIEPRPAT